MASGVVMVGGKTGSCCCCKKNIPTTFPQGPPVGVGQLTFPVMILKLNPIEHTFVCSKECYKFNVMATFHNRSLEM